jgi:uncharacterized glyoxalase superfamily protein PhnB
MTTNPTPTAVTLHAYFGYRDAPAAITWLERVIGFETTMSWPDERGGLAHAELRLGDAAIVVFTDHDGYERPARKGDTGGYGSFLCLPDRAAVDAAWERATSAGAEVVWKVGETEWGNYRFRVLDPEGFEWTFGTHRPGEPQGDWDDAG